MTSRTVPTMEWTPRALVRPLMNCPADTAWSRMPTAVAQTRLVSVRPGVIRGGHVAPPSVSSVTMTMPVMPG